LAALLCGGVLLVTVQGGRAAVPASAAQRGTASVPVGGTIACSSAVSPGPALSTVQTRFTTGLSEPFGVAFSRDGHHVFVSSLVVPIRSSSDAAGLEAPSGVTMYAVRPSGLAYERTDTVAGASLVGMGISPNGRLLAVANQGGASIFSVARLEQPRSSPSSWLLGSFESTGQGAIETTFSSDGAFAFVTLEDSDQIAVFDLRKALRHGFGPADLVGFVPLGEAPVGIAVSPDGRYLYATSESATTAETEGTLTTIDLHRAEQDPSRSIVSTVWAGCSPVRVVASGSSVYVTARASDELVEFSAAGLVTDAGSALIAQVGVGESPVGLAVVDHDKAVVVADSNRFEVGGASSNLAVVSTNGDGRMQLLGYVTAGAFPRDMAVSPDGKSLVVSDFDSGQVEWVALGSLPAPP
jgi:DNA-binding beta-propeller fold protein YncE